MLIWRGVIHFAQILANMSDTFLKNYRITNVVSEKMIIAKIFRFMHVVLKKNFLHDVHTQKAHFETHKYGVLISKK